MHKNCLKTKLNKGLRHQQAGNFEKAAKTYRQILSDNPRQPDALHFMGVIAHRMGNLDDAVELIAESLRIQPSNVFAMNNLAGVLQDQQRLPEALDFYHAALEAAPQEAYLHCNRGVVLKDLGHFEEAISAFRCALQLDPRSYAAHSNLGTVYSERGETAEAVGCYRQALALNPLSYEALSNLGVVLRQRGEFEEAEEYFRRAVAVNAKCDVAYTNLGATLNDLGRYQEAIATYLQALELNSRSHFALNNLGNMLKDLGRFTEATGWFAQAIAAKPDFHLPHNNLGSALLELGRAREAVDCFRHALELKPAYHHALSNLLFALNYLGGTDRAALFAEHRRFDEYYGAPLTRLAAPHANVPDPARRLRVGFVSGDLREHPVGSFIEPVFARHDRANFEFFCYSNHKIHDVASERLRSQVEHWRRVAGWSDDELAGVIRHDGIDILVDLSGHTAHNRLLVFARKPAPVQVSMIGYMQTTGLSAMDYRITDQHLDPIGMTDEFSSEKLVRLTSGAATLQPPADCPEVSELPALTNGHVTFASFNNLAKVTPEVLAAWARIMQAVPTSRLVAIGRAGNSIVQRLGELGIAAERIEMLDRQPLQDYLSLHQRVDFMLDTFPYCGGTTTLFAAWMGVPFVTLAGDSSTSRAGTGLLGGVGLGDELIAQSVAEYVEKAVNAVSNLPKLAEWRAGLRPRLAPLLDSSAGYVQELESQFRVMWRDWCAQRSK